MRDLHCLVEDTLGLPPTAEGALTGLTFVAKDNLAVAGHRSSYGHPRWRETHPPAERTAPAIARLLQAGAELVGLAKLDQLAYSLVGNVGEGEPPVNPLHPDCFSGGSSSGSASAVAGGLAEFALGTDTAGSIRVPAAACGLHSLRPTHGSLDTTGVLPLAPSMDTLGLLARSREVLARVHAVLAKAPDSTPRRILVTDPALEPAARELADRTGASLAHHDFARFLGAEVGEVFARIQGREIWAQHGEWVTRNGQALDPEVLERLHRCRRFSETPGDDDDAFRERYRRELDEVMTPGTVALLPVIPGAPPRRTATLDELRAFRLHTFPLTAPASLGGLPQAVLPPGVGLLGARHEDRGLLI